MFQKFLKKLQTKRSMKRSLKELKEKGIIAEHKTSKGKVTVTFSNEVQNTIKESKGLQKRTNLTESNE